MARLHYRALHVDGFVCATNASLRPADVERLVSSTAQLLEAGDDGKRLVHTRESLPTSSTAKGGFLSSVEQLLLWRPFASGAPLAGRRLSRRSFASGVPWAGTPRAGSSRPARPIEKSLVRLLEEQVQIAV